MIRKEGAELVVIEPALPGMDGFEFAAGLKADPALAGIPVLFVSAKMKLPKSILSRINGPAAFIAKPLLMSELQESVATLLA